MLTITMKVIQMPNTIPTLTAVVIATLLLLLTGV